MSRVDQNRSIQTRERAFEDAWLLYQKQVKKRSVTMIAAMAAAVAIRLGDGSFSPEGGIGRPLAVSTVYWRLSEATAQFRDEFIKRPVIDMVIEEEQRLEDLAALRWEDAMRAETFSERDASLNGYLKAVESKRKLLGIDRPQQVEVVHDVAVHDDQASTKLAKAMADAKERRDEMLAAARRTDQT